MSTWSVKTRHAPSRHCRDARVYGHVAVRALYPKKRRSRLSRGSGRPNGHGAGRVGRTGGPLAGGRGESWLSRVACHNELLNTQQQQCHKGNSADNSCGRAAGPMFFSALHIWLKKSGMLNINRLKDIQSIVRCQDSPFSYKPINPSTGWEPKTAFYTNPACISCTSSTKCKPQETLA